MEWASLSKGSFPDTAFLPVTSPTYFPKKGIQGDPYIDTYCLLFSKEVLKKNHSYFTACSKIVAAYLLSSLTAFTISPDASFKTT